MGYRGSKSEIPLTIKISVKEQRVDGGYIKLYKYNSKLRYTLMGFERNYPFTILSNSIINQKYFYRAISNYPNNPIKEGLFNPLWLTGFIDGEGCFIISIYKNKNKIG